MFKCKEKSCLCSWVAYCDNHVIGATWQTECKKECQENCWRLPNCMWFGVTCWACVLANVTGGGKRPVPINQLVMTCPKTNTLDLSTICLCWLIGTGLFKPTARLLSRKGQSGVLVIRNMTEYIWPRLRIIQPSGHFLGFFVSLTNKKIGPFFGGGGSCPMQRIQSAYSIRCRQSCKLFKKEDCWRWFNTQTLSYKIDREKSTTRWTP